MPKKDLPPPEITHLIDRWSVSRTTNDNDNKRHWAYVEYRYMTNRQGYFPTETRTEDTSTYIHHSYRA